MTLSLDMVEAQLKLAKEQDLGMLCIIYQQLADVMRENERLKAILYPAPIPENEKAYNGQKKCGATLKGQSPYHKKFTCANPCIYGKNYCRLHIPLTNPTESE